MDIVLKMGLIALVITAVISIPMGIILYRYMQNKMASYDYDTSGDGWIKWESQEQWDNWDFTGEKNDSYTSDFNHPGDSCLDGSSGCESINEQEK